MVEFPHLVTNTCKRGVLSKAKKEVRLAICIRRPKLQSCSALPPFRQPGPGLFFHLLLETAPLAPPHSPFPRPTSELRSLGSRPQELVLQLQVLARAARRLGLGEKDSPDARGQGGRGQGSWKAMGPGDTSISILSRDPSFQKTIRTPGETAGC